MASVLDKLIRATNLLSHHLDDRITEIGIGTPEYLVLRAAISTRPAHAAYRAHDAGYASAADRGIDP
jgi:hypothetical protein